MENPQHETEVKEYYEANTALFARWEGRRHRPLPIHRRIWAPGVVTAEGALDWIHAQLLPLVRQAGLVVDWGCGTGAALQRWVQEGVPSRLVGLTLSPRQAQEARGWLGNRAEVLVGSYLDPNAWPSGPGPALYYGVESLVHCADPAAFRHLLHEKSRPGDRLALCDDFLARAPANNTERGWLAAFSSGWKAPCLETFDDWQRGLEARGWVLESHLDLSPWADNGGFWRRLGARLGVQFPENPAWSANLRGGSALVLGYPAGLFQYLFAVWVKQ